MPWQRKFLNSHGKKANKKVKVVVAWASGTRGGNKLHFPHT